MATIVDAAVAPQLLTGPQQGGAPAAHWGVEEMDELTFRHFVAQNLQALAQQLQGARQGGGSSVSELFQAHEELKAATTAKEELLRELSAAREAQRCEVQELERRFRDIMQERDEAAAAAERAAAQAAGRTQREMEALQREATAAQRGAVARLKRGEFVLLVGCCLLVYALYSSWARELSKGGVLLLVCVVCGLSEAKWRQEWECWQPHFSRALPAEAAAKAWRLERELATSQKRCAGLEAQVAQLRAAQAALEAQLDPELLAARQPQLLLQIGRLVAEKEALRAQVSAEAAIVAQGRRSEAQVKSLAAATTKGLEQTNAGVQELARAAGKALQLTQDEIREVQGATDAKMGQLARATAGGFRGAFAQIGEVAHSAAEGLEHTNEKLGLLKEATAAGFRATSNKMDLLKDAAEKKLGQLTNAPVAGLSADVNLLRQRNSPAITES